ncbi:HlyD family efflux transporter periplasmic adaptor subunit [Chryseobacterium culicis]|uniref:HlyD family secretion protein n=1 Tax=Chryseobacterium culicis TaxID=680127 RepID=A0A2S9D2H7_CHRCI|nr:HlyD family efflux transporter periplasmic adaptor subunit [Chryseobacterium culicis]PRB86950.1 hypothetical protein CQ022_12115 [Chryseobacterium culicis]PRB92702.1 hypothetical protein CQ033_05785 [Chryseobacterium culicis]
MEAKKNISDKLKLHSESVQKILSTSPHWMIRWGNTIVLIVLLLIILMSYFIKYPDYIRAPIIVTSQNRPEKIMAGDTAVSILPKEEERFVGKMVIPMEDALKVTPGQKVLIQFDNYHSQEYGVVEGKAQKITETSDKTGKYYVKVILPKGLKISDNKNFYFDQELKGDAEIITKDVRLIDRFFHKIR